MTETITAETEVSKAAMIAREYIDSSGHDGELIAMVPHLIEAIRIIFVDAIKINNQFFWRSPIGKQLFTIKNAAEMSLGASYQE